MPATHSKQFGMETCLPLGNITFSFNSTLYIFLELPYDIQIVAVLQVEFLPILGVHKTQAAQHSTVRDCRGLILLFYDAPYISNRRQIWTAGRTVKHMHSIPTEPCCCNSEYRKRPGIVLLKWTWGFLGNVIAFWMVAHASPKFQHKSLHQWYLHLYSDHPWRGHWCTSHTITEAGFCTFHW